MDAGELDRPGRPLHDQGPAGAEFGLPIRPAELPLAPDNLAWDSCTKRFRGHVMDAAMLTTNVITLLKDRGG